MNSYLIFLLYKKKIEKIILNQCYSPFFCFFTHMRFLCKIRLNYKAQIHRVACHTNYLCSLWISFKSIYLDRFYKHFFCQNIRICDLTPDPTMADICIYTYVYIYIYLYLYMPKFVKSEVMCFLWAIKTWIFAQYHHISTKKNIRFYWKKQKNAEVIA